MMMKDLCSKILRFELIDHAMFMGSIATPAVQHHRESKLKKSNDREKTANVHSRSMGIGQFLHNAGEEFSTPNNHQGDASIGGGDARGSNGIVDSLGSITASKINDLANGMEITIKRRKPTIGGRLSTALRTYFNN